MQPGTRQPMALRPLALGAQDDTSNKIKNKSKNKIKSKKKVNYPTLRQKRAEG